MTHTQKVERMYRHMAALGVSRSTAAPPAWRVLWRMGIEAPPPLFMSFMPVALVLASGIWPRSMGCPCGRITRGPQRAPFERRGRSDTGKSCRSKGIRRFTSAFVQR